MSGLTANPLYDALLRQHRENSNPFLFLENNQQISFADFIHLVGRIAYSIKASGLNKGDRVLVKVAKSPEALAIYAACIQMGTVLVPLNTAYTTAETQYFITDAEPKLIVCDPTALEEISEITAGTDISVFTLTADASGSLIDTINWSNASNYVEACEQDDIAALLYTSGTTGKPKGAMITQGNLLSNAQSLVKCWQFTEQDRLLHALPIFHVHGLFVACNVALMSSCSMIFLPSFDLDTIINSLPQATTMMGVPTFYTRLLNDQRFSRSLTEQMRLFISGSAPMLEETHFAFEKRTGHRILERYGMTETNMITSNPYFEERKIGTVGSPLNSIEIRIKDRDTDGIVDANQIGSIEVKGPNVFKGYWKLPDKTAEEFTADGFFITGDLGFLDEDGYLTIIGRQKDLIISGGFNVYPKEVETVIDAIEGVEESAVIGVPDDDFGEKVVAIVVRQQTSVDESTLIQASKKELAAYKCPKQVYFVDELLRNTMGKVQKNILREQFS